ncbi:MAG: hypothetical protein JXR96_08245 [Deltaproteobacteria bacterium]|nr:hypothetical protein [Deltaproteobacteria bacterium]
MLSRIVYILKERGLVPKIESEIRTMLDFGKTMFEASSLALLERRSVVFDLYAKDREINELVVDIRKKLVEHLTISQATKVDAEVIFIKVISDIERIGDYSKNLMDMARQYGKPLRESDYFRVLKDVFPKILANFPRAEKALFDCDEVPARQVVDSHHKEINAACQGIVTGLLGDESVAGPEAIALALTSRYFKRVSSHLKNVATTAINPFHQIGFVAEQSKD